MLATCNQPQDTQSPPGFFRRLELVAASGLGVATLLLGFQSTNAADSSETSGLRGLTPPGSPLTDKDCQLAFFAREALLKDEVLGPLNLGVTVHSGVATLWGTVPKTDLARLAEEKVRSVPGVAQVKNDLRIVAVDEDTAGFLGMPAFRPNPAFQEPVKRRDRPVPLVSRGEASIPSANSIVTASPLRVPTIQAPAGPARTVSSFEPSPPTSLSQGDKQEMTQSVLKVPPPPRLVETLEYLRRSNERFMPVRFEVQGGVVRLWGNAASGEDVFTLAQQVSRLPGVERVVVEHAR
jgi:hypothetical protein